MALPRKTIRKIIADVERREENPGSPEQEEVVGGVFNKRLGLWGEADELESESERRAREEWSRSLKKILAQQRTRMIRH